MTSTKSTASSLDWIKQALVDYVKMLPISAQQPVLACADFHVGSVARDLGELDSLKAKIGILQDEMERVGAAAPPES